jgi:putative toxin-antitoxin system antitoxin component (TIGR02293 family)
MQKNSDVTLALIEVTETAERVLGSRLAAQEWLTRPAVALDHKCPIDLLNDAPGIQSVKDLLTRIEHGVYS